MRATSKRWIGLADLANDTGDVEELNDLLDEGC
jgi:hypothetical protein